MAINIAQKGRKIQSVALTQILSRTMLHRDPYIIFAPGDSIDLMGNKIIQYYFSWILIVHCY